MAVRAKKQLGQHFLRSSDTARNIADCLPMVCPNCLEIGPGMGILTTQLLEKNINLKVIEIDGESIDYLLANGIIDPSCCWRTTIYGDGEFSLQHFEPNYVQSR